MPKRLSNPKGFGLSYRLMLLLESSQSFSWPLEVLSFSMMSRESQGEPSLCFSHKVAGRVSGFSGLGEQHGSRVSISRPGFDPHGRPGISPCLSPCVHFPSGLYKQLPQGDGWSRLRHTPCGVAISCPTEMWKAL